MLKNAWGGGKTRTTMPIFVATFRYGLGTNSLTKYRSSLNIYLMRSIYQLIEAQYQKNYKTTYVIYITFTYQCFASIFN